MCACLPCDYVCHTCAQGARLSHPGRCAVLPGPLLCWRTICECIRSGTVASRGARWAGFRSCGRNLCGGSWGIVLRFATSPRAKATSFRTVKVMRFFLLRHLAVFVFGICSVTWYLLKKELTDRITRLLLTYFGIGSCSPRWPRTPAAA